MSNRMTGRIKWFNSDKGYGFFTVNGMQKDVFVHAKQLQASGITRTPIDGEEFIFTLNTGVRGQFATDIEYK